MVTRGRVSIDVDEDAHLGHHHHPYGHAYSVPRWSEEDVREDMIRHSVHLPMEPRGARWPGGYSPPGSNDDDLADPENGRGGGGGGVVRALRILPENCRVLSSATRCPFLVRMEVAESGLDADDARLYVASDAGLTVQEALGSLRAPRGNPALGDDVARAAAGLDDDAAEAGGFAPCEVPPELVMCLPPRRRGGGGGGPRPPHQGVDAASSEEVDAVTMGRHRDDSVLRSAFEPPPPYDLPRSHADEIPPSHSGFVNAEGKAVLSRGGGYQGEDYGYDSSPDAFDMVGEHYYEELHHDLRHQRESEFNSPNPSSMMGTVGYVGGVMEPFRYIVLIVFFHSLCSSFSSVAYPTQSESTTAFYGICLIGQCVRPTLECRVREYSTAISI